MWIGRPETAKRETVVGFAIGILVKHLESLTVGIIERLRSLLICIGRNKYAIIFSCYTSSRKSSEEIKENCYSELRSQFRSSSFHEKLLLFGEFNARVVCDTSV